MARSAQQQPSSRPHDIQKPLALENDLHSLIDNESNSMIEADALNEVIMAVNMKNNGDLGCAYYVAAEEVLYLLEDVAMAGTDLVETLLLHAHPTTILLSARAPEVLVQFLERGSGGVDPNKSLCSFPMSLGRILTSLADSVRDAYILRNLNSTDFQHESARYRLSKLEIGQLNCHSIQYSTVVDDDEDMLGEVGSGSRQGQMLRLSAAINTESQLTVGFQS